MNDGRWAKETLLTAIRLLCHRSMEANDGGHWHHASRVVGYVVAYNAPNLVVRIIRVVILQFPFTSRGLESG
jgi:hypothetical protein